MENQRFVNTKRMLLFLGQTSIARTASSTRSHVPIRYVGASAIATSGSYNFVSDFGMAARINSCDNVTLAHVEVGTKDEVVI